SFTAQVYWQTQERLNAAYHSGRRSASGGDCAFGGGAQIRERRSVVWQRTGRLRAGFRLSGREQASGNNAGSIRGAGNRARPDKDFEVDWLGWISLDVQGFFKG